MFLKQYKNGVGEQLILASMSEGRIAICNETRGVVTHDISLPEDCGRAFALAPNDRFLATGYWYKPGIEVRDIGTGEPIACFGRNQISGLCFDRSSAYVVFRSQKGCFVHDLARGTEDAIRGTSDSLYDAMWRGEGNEMWVPTNRRGIVVRIRFDPVRAETHSLPVSGRVFCMRWSPRADSYFVIDSTRTVYAFDAADERPTWKSVLREHMLAPEDNTYVGAYSGNGCWVGVIMTLRSGFRSIVIDSATGQVVHVVEGCRGEGEPFGPTSVMRESGEVVDLLSGQVTQDLSHPTWWRSRGLQRQAT